MTQELTAPPALETKLDARGYHREITISRAATLCAQLDYEASAAQAIAVAQNEGGVLVTRHEGHRFTIEITSEVPFGLTQERDLAP